MMTEKQIRQYHQKVDENIRESGFNITYVSASDTPSFCYSTGVYQTYGIPEIFISSLPPNLSYEIVNQYIDKFRGTVKIPVGQKIDDLTLRFPVYLISVPTSLLSDYVLTSIRFYKNEYYEYIQLVYPDTNGNFPDDTGYDYDQVVVG